MFKILIADDSRVFRNILNEKLKTEYEVVGQAVDGITALKIYQENKPDLVVLDITMPNCSGKECLKNILAVDADAKVVMVSGIGDDQTLLECLQMGAKAFVRKDLISQLDDPQNCALLRTVQDILANKNNLESA